MWTSMRHPAVALFGLALAAPAFCVTMPDRIFPANFEAAPDCLPAGSTGCPGFVIATYVPIDPGQAISLCYYFRTGSAGAIGVGRFSSRLGPAVHNIAVYTTADSTTQLPADRQPPGTLTSTGCGFGTGDNIADRRIYSAHQAAEQLRMPDDDGAGRPLAIELPANAAGAHVPPPSRKLARSSRASCVSSLYWPNRGPGRARSAARPERIQSVT